MRPVTLFIPCLVDAFAPEVGAATVRVFRKLGITVRYPEGQTCCGQPAFNAGHRRRARAAAEHFLRVFDGRGPIVCPSGSCVHTVRHHYRELFRFDPGWTERAEAVARRTFEFSEYLVDHLGIDDLGASARGRVTYHDSCHLRHGLGIADAPRRLLGRVTGIAVVEMTDADHCCGFGGSFSIHYADISAALLADKVRNIRATGAQTVVGCDMGCLMNIEGMLKRQRQPIRVRHLAQLLAGDG